MAEPLPTPEPALPPVGAVLPPAPSRRSSWRVFVVLMAGALVGIVAVVPYTLTLLHSLPGVGSELPSLWILVPLQVGQGLVLTALATALGLWLGPGVGLGAPLVHSLLAGDRGARTLLRASARPALVLGALVGVGVLLLDLWFAPRLPETVGSTGVPDAPVWQGLLAAFYGAVPEELLLRLGLMTFLVWLGTRLTRSAIPGSWVMWTAIGVTVVLFGVGHLPATAGIWPLTPLVVARALLLNGLAGLVFGWLYWRRGLLAAMLAHLSADLVLQTAAALLS